MPVSAAIRQRVRVQTSPEGGGAVGGDGVAMHRRGGRGPISDRGGACAPCRARWERSILGDSRGSGDFCRTRAALG